MSAFSGGDPSAWQVPFPNRLTASDLNESILQHMADNLDFRLSEVIRLVAANIPNQATSTYFLLQQKWAKWKSSQRGSHQGSHSQSRLGTSHRKVRRPPRTLPVSMMQKCVVIMTLWRCEGNPSVTGGLPPQRASNTALYVFFVVNFYWLLN